MIHKWDSGYRGGSRRNELFCTQTNTYFQVLCELAGCRGHYSGAVGEMAVSREPDSTGLPGVPWWLSRLRIWCCRCYRAGLIPGPGMFICCRYSQKKKRLNETPQCNLPLFKTQCLVSSPEAPVSLRATEPLS